MAEQPLLERWKRINAALNSDVFKAQQSVWEEQRDSLRSILCELWQDGTDFKNWWTTLNEDTRTALLLAAIEDLPNSASSDADFILSVCPELSLKELVQFETYESQKSTNSLFKLLDRLTEGKENGETNALFKEFVDDLRKSLDPQGNESSAQDIDKLFNANFKTQIGALRVGRSCFLLQFAVNVMLIFHNDDMQEPDQ